MDKTVVSNKCVDNSESTDIIAETNECHSDFSDSSAVANDKGNQNDYNELQVKLESAILLAHGREQKIKRLEQLVLELQNRQVKSSFDNQDVTNRTDSDNNKSLIPNSSFINVRKILLFLIICLPSLLVFIYSVFIYNNMYIASSTFTIKSNGNEKISDLSSQFGFFGGGDNKDLYTASAYIQSLDMFRALDAKLDLINHFSGHDIVSSMPNNPTQSDIENYWKSVVEVKLDTESELMKLQVRSYEPYFSQTLSQGILDELEKFINNMNNKITQDSIRLASIEVEKAKKDIETISDRIRRFRDQNTFIDPNSEASNLLSIINNLENLITQSKADLAQKRAYLREDSVDIVSLKNKISSLEQEVISLRSRIAQNKGVTLDTSGDSALANVLTRTMSEFEQLKLEYQFAQKVLEAALNNLETTRQHSLSKSKYLVTIDNPKIPDESLWPRPFLATIVTFIVTIFLLSAISLLISAIKEHLGI
ncbi:hypothetical protein [Succinimonas amylolytica]|uniref:hypothetical protein n=1 Tax=Succinimonas amylolytica TaxID=83769 RepID=UPI00036DD6B9|nr:hypothetical protein [Succinimonas amylolytica]